MQLRGMQKQRRDNRVGAYLQVPSVHQDAIPQPADQRRAGLAGTVVSQHFEFQWLLAFLIQKLRGILVNILARSDQQVLGPSDITVSCSVFLLV